MNLGEFARTRGAKDKKKRKKKILLGFGASAVSTGGLVIGDQVGLARQQKLKREYLSLARSQSRTDRRMASLVNKEGAESVADKFSQMYRSPYRETYREATKTKLLTLGDAVKKNKQVRQKLIKNIRTSRMSGRIIGKVAGTGLALGGLATISALESRKKKRK